MSSYRTCLASVDTFLQTGSPRQPSRLLLQELPSPDLQATETLQSLHYINCQKQIIDAW